MSEWPLHITLADVFAIKRDDTKIDMKLEQLASTQSRLNIRAREQARLGDAEVVLIQKTPQLVALHEALMDLLEANGAVFNTPGFTRGGFLPHATIQRSGRLHEGDEVGLHALALVDMFPEGDWMRRKIIKIFELRLE